MIVVGTHHGDRPFCKGDVCNPCVTHTKLMILKVVGSESSWHKSSVNIASSISQSPKCSRYADSVRRAPPGGDPGGELTGTYVQEGVLRWGCGGAEPPRSRPAQRKKMGSIGCLKRFSTED